KMPAFEWVHVQLHQQKGMISLSPPTICNSAIFSPSVARKKNDAGLKGVARVQAKTQGCHRGSSLAGQ
ncbi:hypothetical protein ACEA49_24735, partial [Escherichia coli]